MSQPYQPDQPDRPSNPWGGYPNHPGGYGAPPPPPGAPPTGPPPPQPKKRRAWVVPAAVGGVMGLLLGAATCSGADPGTTGVPAATRTVTATAPAPAGKPAPTVTVTQPADEAPAPAPKAGTSFGDGENMPVGDEIKPGSYRADNPDGECYYQVSKDDTADMDSIVVNGNPTGPVRIKLKKGQYMTSQRCGVWRKV